MNNRAPMPNVTESTANLICESCVTFICSFYLKNKTNKQKTSCVLGDFLASVCGRATAPPAASGGGAGAEGVIALPLPLRSGKEKKKLFFLYRRNQQPPSCRGSELGFRSNSGFNAEFEHPFRDMTPPSARKHRRSVAPETFCAKKLELDRRSSGKKAPYM